MPLEMERIFTDLAREKADLILLILASQGIAAQVEKQVACDPFDPADLFDILVPREKIRSARTSVGLYYRENKGFRPLEMIQNFEISSFTAPAAFGIMGLLWVIHLVCLEYGILDKAILKFGASSLYIGQGQTFRAITALFLHSDGQHLLGNMVGLLIFGAPLITLSGYGTGPFLLLCAGTCGNLVNAYFHQNALLSIGASTAIMGAAGYLAAFQMTGKSHAFQLKSLIPLVAGATLMGLFSQGERTDVSAHVFGFASGFCIGILYFPWYGVVKQTRLKGMIEPGALMLLALILGSAVWAGL